MILFPSACIWTYQTTLEDTLRRIKESAFLYIDVEPENLQADHVPQTVQELGLKVSCVALDHHLPAGASLGGKAEAARRQALDYLIKALDVSAAVGARAAYLQPCAKRHDASAYLTSVTELASIAAKKGIKLCVEHSPNSSLPAAADVLKFIEAVGHSNLFMLLDIGHLLLTNERPWEVVAAAGTRLGYVQMDDNDGKADRHWPLLDGILTLADMEKTMRALKDAGYEGTVGLELSRKLPSLIAGLSKNRNLVLRLQHPEAKSLKEPEARRKP